MIYLNTLSEEAFNHWNTGFVKWDKSYNKAEVPLHASKENGVEGNTDTTKYVDTA